MSNYPSGLDYWRKRLAELRIPEDITPLEALRLEAQIDELYSEARLELAEAEREKGVIDRLIDRLLKKRPEGGNSDDRLRRSVEAIEAYHDGTQVRNLFEVQDRLHARYLELRGVIDVLASKHERIITISGLMKLEEGLVRRS